MPPQYLLGFSNRLWYLRIVIFYYCIFNNLYIGQSIDKMYNIGKMIRLMFSQIQNYQQDRWRLIRLLSLGFFNFNMVSTCNFCWFLFRICSLLSHNYNVNQVLLLFFKQNAFRPPQATWMVVAWWLFTLPTVSPPIRAHAGRCNHTFPTLPTESSPAPNDYWGLKL